MPTGKRIPAADIRRVWLDPALSTAEAAAQVGLTRSNLWRRAKGLGLPPRKVGNQFRIIDRARFAAMWRAGVLGREIAAHFGACYTVVRATARRLGLPPRALGSRPAITMREFAQVELGERMAEEARREAAARAERLREAA